MAMSKTKSTPLWKLALLGVVGFVGLVAGLAVVVVVSEWLGPSTPAVAVSESRPAQRPAERAPAWYEGGTLHRSTGAAWRAADARDKLATCSDFLAHLWSGGELTFPVATIDDLRTPSSECVRALDQAFAPPSGDDDPMGAQRVAEVAVVSFALMGYVR